jgi:hypothetical protein
MTAFTPGQVLTAAALNAAFDACTQNGAAAITGGTITGIETLNVAGTTDSGSPSTGAMTVAGGVGIALDVQVGGSITVGDDVYVNGTSNSTSTTTGALVVIGGVGVGGNANVGGSVDVTGSVTAAQGEISSTTDSSSTTTGALVVIGGVGIGKTLNVGTNANVGGNLVVSSTADVQGTTNSTGVNSGALVVAGGVGVGLNLNVGGSAAVSGAASVASTTDSSSTTTGALTVAGGLGVAKTLNVGTNANVGGNLVVTGTTTHTGSVAVNATTASSSTTTGALTVAGGVGIQGAVNVGGNVSLGGTTTMVGAVTADGALTVDGALTLGASASLVFPDGSTMVSNGQGELAINTTGGTVTLTPAQAASNNIFKVTGALTSALIIVFPASPKLIVVNNGTTGAYSLTVEATGEAPNITVGQGIATIAYTDATGCYAISSASISLPLAVNQGGTGSSTVVGALSNLGIGAISGRNRIINGSCRVTQLPSFTNSGGNGYGGPDRFQCSNGGPNGAFVQSSGTITMPSPSAAVKPCVLQQVSTAASAFATSQYWGGIQHNIEGTNCFDLKGQQIAVSFVFYANTGGTYSVSLSDGTGAYTCVQTFSYTASTVQNVSLVFPAMPSATSTTNSNAVGLILRIGAIAGSGLTTSTVGTWQNANYIMASGSVNWTTATSNFISATDIQLEAGNASTPFNRLPFSQELANCRRYRQRITVPSGTNQCGVDVGFFTSTTAAVYTLNPQVSMRIAPTVTSSNLYVSNYASQSAGTSTTVGTCTVDSVTFTIGTTSTSWTAGQGSLLYIGTGTGGGYLDYNAEY